MVDGGEAGRGGGIAAAVVMGSAGTDMREKGSDECVSLTFPFPSGFSSPYFLLSSCVTLF